MTRRWPIAIIVIVSAMLVRVWFAVEIAETDRALAQLYNEERELKMECTNISGRIAVHMAFSNIATQAESMGMKRPNSIHSDLRTSTAAETE